MIYAEICKKVDKESRTFTLSKNNYYELEKEYFQVGDSALNDSLPVSIVDKGHEYLFSLVLEKPFLPVNDWRVFHIPFDESLCRKGMDYYDFSVFNTFEEIIFREIDTYSIFLSKIISLGCPDIKVFWDSPIAFIINEVCGDRFFLELNKKQNGCFKKRLVISRNNTGEHDLIDTHYVMQYVIAGHVRHRLGYKNKDKTILLVDFPVGSNGMGDAVKIANGMIGLALKKGWIPVINYCGDNQYLDSAEDNMWGYYFDQPGEVSVEEAMGSYSVISSEENLLGMNEFLASPYMEGLIDGDYGRIQFNEEVLKRFSVCKEIEQLTTIRNEGKKTLGVILRGSDMSKGRRSDFHIDYMLDQIRILDEENNYEALFLATEDELYFRRFCEEFKTHTIIYIEQKRVERNYDLSPFVLVADLPEMEKGRMWGEKYLQITYALSQCDELAYSMSAGTKWLADRWKKVRGERYKEEYNISSFEDVSSDRYLQDLSNFIESKEKAVLYGIGQMCERLYLPLRRYSDKIIYCDKKSEKEYECFYHGRKVYRINEIVDMTFGKDTGIIITPFSHISDIVSELEMMNIKGDILILKEVIDKYR